MEGAGGGSLSETHVAPPRPLRSLLSVRAGATAPAAPAAGRILASRPL